MRNTQQILPLQWRGTIRRMVEGIRRQRCLQWGVPSVSRCASATSPYRGGF